MGRPIGVHICGPPWQLCFGKIEKSNAGTEHENTNVSRRCPLAVGEDRDPWENNKRHADGHGQR